MPELVRELEAAGDSKGLLQLGALSGQLDMLLKLRETDSTNLRELASEIKSSISQIREEIRVTGNQVSTLASNFHTLQAEQGSLSHLVRDNESSSLVIRLTTVENDLVRLREAITTDRSNVNKDMDNLRMGLEADFKGLREEVHKFAAEAKQRDSKIADQNIAAAKDQRTFHRNVMLAVLGSILSLVVTMVSMWISSTWK